MTLPHKEIDKAATDQDDGNADQEDNGHLTYSCLGSALTDARPDLFRGFPGAAVAN
jgi:hypothetical protein